MKNTLRRFSFMLSYFFSKVLTWLCRFASLTVLLISVTAIAQAKDLNKNVLNEFRNKYLNMSPNKYNQDIKDIFNNYPIYTNVIFPILSVEDTILDKMFSDLDYTGRVGHAYAGSPYIITREKDCFRAKVSDVVDGTIHILREDKANNQFVYLVKGYYDAFVTLRGKMIVEVKYEPVGDFIKFDIDVFVIIDNSILWRLARYLKESPTFQAKIDHLIEINVKNTINLGRRTVSGIQRDLKGIEF